MVKRHHVPGPEGGVNGPPGPSRPVALPPDTDLAPLVARLAQDQLSPLPRGARVRADPEALRIAPAPVLPEEVVDLLEDRPERERLPALVLDVVGDVELGPEPARHELVLVVPDRALVVEDRRRDLLDDEHALVRPLLQRVHDHRPEP